MTPCKHCDRCVRCGWCAATRDRAGGYCGCYGQTEFAAPRKCMCTLPKNVGGDGRAVPSDTKRTPPHGTEQKS
jgi:hypothetical protein